MSTSGLITSVTPPLSLCVSTSASALAPGKRGPMTHAPRTTTAPAAAAAGRVIDSGLRARPRTVRGVWANRIRSRAAARNPAATSASVRATR